MEITFDTFPVFEANQVLTSGHLNDVFDYLDQQARQTRSHLVGIGIVCGLDIAPGANASIVLSKGCGVTSEGYLILEPEDVTLTSYRTYTLPSDIAYDSFMNGSAQYAMWELFPDGSPGTTALSSAFLSGKAMLLFLELKKDSLRNCSPNNCDDKGSQVTATVRRLLVAKSDLDAIVSAANALGSGLTSDDIDQALSARLNLPDLRQLRFDVTATNPVSSNDVYAGFLATFTGAGLATALGNALGAAYTAFLPLLVKAYPANPFASFAATYGFLDSAPTTTAQVKFLQYYFDLFDDLLRAYDEFRWKGLDLVCACCPPDDIFPRHLMIGVPSMPDSPGKYRQGFLPSPAVGDCADETEEVLQLFARLVEMTARFTNAPTLPAPNQDAQIDPQIRATPSTIACCDALADKAIPYYYAETGTPPLYKLWSPQKTRRNRANQSLGYNSDLYSPAAPAFVTDPLRYDLEPHDFLRIEGHLGKNYAKVLSSLLNLKAQYRVPIDVIALRTGAYDDGVTVDLTKETARFQDLDALYESLAGDLQLALAEGVMELYDTPVTGLSTAGGTPALPLLKTYAPNYRFSAGTVGAWYESYISRFEGTPYIDVDQNNINASSVALTVYCPMFNTTTGLPNTQYAHAVSVYYLSKLSEIMTPTIDTLAFTDFQNKYQDLIGLIRFFRSNAVASVPATLQDFLPQEELLTICEGILFGCKLGAIGAVHDEYAKRIGDLKKRQFLSTFLADHPGIRHKAGVPLGGTFILVYHEPPPASAAIPVFPIETFNIEQAAAAQPLTLEQAAAPAPAFNVAQAGAAKVELQRRVLAQTTSAPVTATARAQASAQSALADAITRITTNRTLSNNPDINLLVGSLIGKLPSFPPIQLPGGTSDAATQIIASAVGELADGAVIADFFLPYQISCDCPGVQYVLPKPMPSFTAQVGCTGTGNTAPVTVAAKGGIAPYDISIDAAAYQALGDDPLPLAPGAHSLMLRDADGTETPSQSITVPTAIAIGAESYQCNNGNFTVAAPISGGTPPYAINGQRATAIATAPAASGSNVTVTVEDAAGCSLSVVYTHTCPPPCTLPGGGAANKRGFKFFMPDPDPNNAYKTATIAVPSFTVESATGTSIDFTKAVGTLLNPTPADLAASVFPATVARWVQALNALIVGTPSLNQGATQWVTFSYTPATVGGRMGTLWIEYFDQLKFNIQINSQLAFVTGQQAPNVNYSPSGTSIVQGSSTVTMPPFDGTETDKCAGTPPANICSQQGFQVGVVVNSQGGLAASFTAAPSPAQGNLTYVWEALGATPPIANGPTYAPTFASAGSKTVLVTAYTPTGCSVAGSAQITLAPLTVGVIRDAPTINIKDTKT